MAGLQGSRVIVLGGSSGIGLATAQAAAVAGAHVTIASRSAERLDAALAGLGPLAARQVLDTREDAAVAEFFGRAAWDHLVIAAAETRTGGARTLPMDDAYAAMDSKFWGAYRAAREARIREGGSITLVAGGLAIKPSAGGVLQGAINAALESLGRGLALELAPIRVNTISPGLIETPLQTRLGDAAWQKRREGAIAHLPLHRVGQAEDIAQAILFLMTSAFTTGATLRVDGGSAIA